MVNEFKSKLSFVGYVLTGIGIGTIIGLTLLHTYIGWDEETINIAKVASFLLVGFAAVGGIFQLAINARQAKNNTKQIKYSNEWNKKQLASNRLHESRKVIKAAHTELHSILSVKERPINEPFEIHEIHNAIGVFSNSGDLIFHCEHCDEDIKNLPQDHEQKSEHINKFEKDIDGRRIKDSILELLGEYEYIAMNVNQEIFNKKTVTDLMGMPFIQTYKVFSEYINHLRFEHNFGASIYKEFETLAKEIEIERIDASVSKIKKLYTKINRYGTYYSNKANKTAIQGKDISENLIELLKEYESISMKINKGIFDKELVIDRYNKFLSIYEEYKDHIHYIINDDKNDYQFKQIKLLIN